MGFDDGFGIAFGKYSKCIRAPMDSIFLDLLGNLELHNWVLSK